MQCQLNWCRWQVYALKICWQLEALAKKKANTHNFHNDAAPASSKLWHQSTAGTEGGLSWKGILCGFPPIQQPQCSVLTEDKCLVLQGADLEQEPPRRGLGALVAEAARMNTSLSLVLKELSWERCHPWVKHSAISWHLLLLLPGLSQGAGAEAQAGTGLSCPQLSAPMQKTGGADASCCRQHLHTEALMSHIEGHFQKFLHFPIFWNRQEGDWMESGGFQGQERRWCSQDMGACCTLWGWSSISSSNLSNRMLERVTEPRNVRQIQKKLWNLLW